MIVKMNRLFFSILVAFTSTMAFAQSNIFDGITEDGLKLYQSRESEISMKLENVRPRLLDIPNDPNSETAKRRLDMLQIQMKHDLRLSDEESMQIAKIIIAKKYNMLDIAMAKIQIPDSPKTEETEIDISEHEDGEDGIITDTFIKNIQKYKEFGSFHDGLARVGRNGKYGYMNIKGEEIIPCSYTDADDFSNGIARVRIDGKTKHIDVNGNEVPSPNTQSSVAANLQSSNGLTIKEVNGKYGYADASGKIVIPCKYDGAKPFRNGYAAVEKYEYINGAPVMSDEYDPRWGVIDESGKVIIPFKYNFYYDAENDIPLFSEGIAIVQDKAEQFGYYDENGKKITPCKYTEAQPFSNGVAFVKFEKKLGEQGNKVRYAMYVGYVDKNGAEALVEYGVKEGTITYEDGMKFIHF